jgi:DNA-binding CsgD family transcriptional regulator
MELLERDRFLDELAAALKRAAQGDGVAALVSGEAGIGKTSLVREFVRRNEKIARILWGACDALFTPRPLGPLHDIAPHMGEQVAELLDVQADRVKLFTAVLDDLRRSPAPTLLVFEDVHWADEATLDLIKFLCRRIHQTRALFILTYRDDELHMQHPLRLVIGDLSRSTTIRLQLLPLSQASVTALAAEANRAEGAEDLYITTGGNPFFVTEVLASQDEGVPATVRDAVLARAARLSLSGRATLDAAAVIGPRIELPLLAEVVGAEAPAVEECMAVGMLGVESNLLTFQHELARQTILASISPQRKLILHRLTLAALSASPTTQSDLARLAHHAEGAGDREAVLQFAPEAARQAAKVGAHREAAAQYALSLHFADGLPAVERAQLLEAYAWESNIIDQRDEGIAARRKAHQIWQQQGDLLRQSENLARLAVMLVLTGRHAEAEQASRAAIDAVQALPPSRELALAYRTQAFLSMLNGDNAQAISWGEKSIALAERFDDKEVLALAYNVVGTALRYSDYERGCACLERSLTIAREAGLNLNAVNALNNLGAGSGELFYLHRAERYLAEGIAFASECDFDSARLYMQAWQALTFLYLGRWNHAAETDMAVLQRPGASANIRIMALVALGRLRTRRGDPGAMAALDEALELAERTGELQRLGPVRAARAEAVWLAGDQKRTLEEARAVYDLAVSKQHPWFVGEFAFWRWRAGEDVSAPAWAARPFALHIAGDWQGAAEEWARLDCPYEQARALADGDESAQLRALELFERLGARPAVEAVREKLRAVPARMLEKEKFGRLTEREREVASLIAQGKSNREIAEAMVVSVKTIETYVTRILNKLGFDSRVQVAMWAVEKGLTRTSAGS